MRRAMATAILVGLVSLAACDDDPAGPAPEPPGTIEVGEVGERMLGYVQADGVVLAVQATNLQWEPARSLGAMDLSLVNTGGATAPTVPAPLHLVIRSLDPFDVQLVNPDGLTDAQLPFRAFTDRFGPDGVLVPGEVSSPLRYEFDYGGNSGFTVEFDAVPRSALRGTIEGRVFIDYDEDGIQSGEAGVQNVAVALRTDGQLPVATTRTGWGGQYRFEGLDAARYEVTADLGDPVSVTTRLPVPVELAENPDGRVDRFDTAHIGLGPGPLRAGLLARFALDGTAEDSSGNGNHGTVVGDVLWPDRSVFLGAVAQLDGEDDYVLAEDPPALDPEVAVSIALWCRFDDVPAQGEVLRHPLVTRGGGFLPNDWTLTFAREGNPVGGNLTATILFSVRTTAGHAGDAFSFPIREPGAWHHVAAVYDGERIRIDLDDQSARSRAYAPAPLDGAGYPLCLGYDPDTGSFLDGALDDVRIYARALTEVEVRMVAEDYGPAPDESVGRPVAHPAPVAPRAPRD